jgi:hypothetical protein
VDVFLPEYQYLHSGPKSAARLKQLQQTLTLPEDTLTFLLEISKFLATVALILVTGLLLLITG